MGFTVVCHRCGEIIYEGIDMIPFYRLMSECNGRCPACKRRLALPPIKVEIKHIVE